jgi:hypothetical protein
MAQQTTPNLHVLNTPFCGQLRSKKYYMSRDLPLKEEDFIDDSNHCWCYHTQTPIGPDGNIAMPERCVPGRSCYESALADHKKVQS